METKFTKFTPDLLREHADYILSVPDFVGSPEAISDALRWGADQAAISAELLEALQEFEISDCPDCDASGLEEIGRGDACRRCGGAGEIITGGWPEDIRAAITKATT